MKEPNICRHLAAITEVKLSDVQVCEECVRNNTEWVHLRICQTCGQTLCCDDSPKQHMSKHVRATGHPVIASAQPGERWLWCYPDEEMMGY